MPRDPAQFSDDPALRAALQRALGKESAPAELRARIVGSSLTSDTAPKRGGTTSASRLIIARSPFYRVAVAAILLIGFGALGYRIWQMNRSPFCDPVYPIPNSLYTLMVKTHTDRGAQASPDPVRTLTSAAGLSSQIQRPVFVADLTRDGWTFQGAAVRNVGQYSAGQLYFTKGKEAISVFSLPASAASGAREGSDYDTVFNGAPIAGFTKGEGLYCIVGTSPDGSLSVDEVKRLLSEHRGEISKG